MVVSLVSPMTLSLKSEVMVVSLKGEKMATLATTLEEIVVSVVPTLATILEGAEVVVSPVSTRGTTLEAMALNLKGQMPTYAMTAEGPDSDAAACPTTTNSLKPTESTTNAG